MKLNGGSPSGQEGGAPIENQRILRIHLALKVSTPEGTTLFQALTLAFWWFQGVAVTALFAAVLQALETRTRTELESRFSGRVRAKGRRRRQWQLPFGAVQLVLVRLRDRLARRMVDPLKEALALPGHVGWCEHVWQNWRVRHGWLHLRACVAFFTNHWAARRARA